MKPLIIIYAKRFMQQSNLIYRTVSQDPKILTITETSFCIRSKGIKQIDYLFN